jgi:DNA-directed RNA polymerase specialized sigma subunit
MTSMSLLSNSIDESKVRMVWPSSDFGPDDNEKDGSSGDRSALQHNKETLDRLAKQLSHSERKHLASLRIGVTQTAFAKSQNVSRSAICQRESKLIKKLKKLAHAYLK